MALDLNVLRMSWDKVKSLDDFKEGNLGVNMMVKIFTRNPHLKYMWSFANDLNNESDIRAAPLVKSHGRNVMRSINSVIEKLDNPEDAEKLLYNLGVRHLKFKSKVEYMPIITGALGEVIKEGLGSAFDKDAEIAWGHAINFVATHVSRGLLSEPVNA